MKRREMFIGTEVSSAACKPGTRRMATLIPNARFRTQDNKEVRFYDDMIKGKQVIVMMMYANCDTFCPLATKIMVDLHHKALAHRMGKDLFMVNVSLKPWEDDPATLREYAKLQGALLPGWTFLTGDRYDVDTLRYRFFSHDHIGIDLDEDLHAGSMKLINDRTGVWMHGDAFASTRTLLDHVEWLKPPKSRAETLAENERLQKQIDQERHTFGYRKIA
jgi:protein SCO1/2